MVQMHKRIRKDREGSTITKSKGHPTVLLKSHKDKVSGRLELIVPVTNLNHGKLLTKIFVRRFVM